MSESKPAPQPRGDTPRTDAQTGDHATFHGVQFVSADFARTLERELTAAESALAAERGWRDLSVCAVAAENSSVMEYCRQFDATITDLQSRLDAAERVVRAAQQVAEYPEVAEYLGLHVWKPFADALADFHAISASAASTLSTEEKA